MRRWSNCNHGLELDGKPLKPAEVSWAERGPVALRAARRQKAADPPHVRLVGLQVVGLKRVRIGSVVLGDLPVGQWRYLRDDERF